jgi:hypothetical protein
MRAVSISSTVIPAISHGIRLRIRNPQHGHLTRNQTPDSSNLFSAEQKVRVGHARREHLEHGHPCIYRNIFKSISHGMAEPSHTESDSVSLPRKVTRENFKTQRFVLKVFRGTDET